MIKRFLLVFVVLFLFNRLSFTLFGDNFGAGLLAGVIGLWGAIILWEYLDERA